MADTQALRASDRERQDVVDRLRTAVGDGRLRMDEYMERMETAYQAVTVGDLAPLTEDLPGARTVADRQPDAVRAPKPAAMTGRPRSLAAPLAFVAGLPAVLRVLWAVWLTAVLVNVVVWVLVSGPAGHLMYPWPLWVAGPFGAVLVALSTAATAFRRGRS